MYVSAEVLAANPTHFVVLGPKNKRMLYAYDGESRIALTQGDTMIAHDVNDNNNLNILIEPTEDVDDAFIVVSRHVVKDRDADYDGVFTSHVFPANKPFIDILKEFNSHDEMQYFPLTDDYNHFVNEDKTVMLEFSMGSTSVQPVRTQKAIFLGLLGDVSPEWAINHPQTVAEQYKAKRQAERAQRGSPDALIDQLSKALGIDLKGMNAQVIDLGADPKTGLDAILDSLTPKTTAKKVDDAITNVEGGYPVPKTPQEMTEMNRIRVMANNVVLERTKIAEYSPEDQTKIRQYVNTVKAVGQNVNPAISKLMDKYLAKVGV